MFGRPERQSLAYVRTQWLNIYVSPEKQHATLSVTFS